MKNTREVPCQLAFEFDALPAVQEISGPANVKSNVVQVFFGQRRTSPTKVKDDVFDHATIVNQVLLDARMLSW